jgi:hypothetical protein
MRSAHDDFPLIAREKELAALQDAYQGPHNAFRPPSVVIYSFDRSKGAGRNDPKT